MFVLSDKSDELCWGIYVNIYIHIDTLYIFYILMCTHLWHTIHICVCIHTHMYIYLATPCSMQDLNSLIGIKPLPVVSGAQSVNHWTARKAPWVCLCARVFASLSACSHLGPVHQHLSAGRLQHLNGVSGFPLASSYPDFPSQTTWSVKTSMKACHCFA